MVSNPGRNQKLYLRASASKASKSLGSYGNVRLFFAILFVICAVCAALINDKEVLPAPGKEEAAA